MSLLDYKPLCRPTSCTTSSNLLLFYSKTSTYTIHHTTTPELTQTLLHHLNATNATNKAGETRLVITTGEYKMVVLACVGSQTVEDIRVAAANGVKVFRAMKVEDMVVSVEYRPEDVGVGVGLGYYKYDILNKDKKDNDKNEDKNKLKNKNEDNNNNNEDNNENKSNKKIKIAACAESKEFELGLQIAYHQNFARFLADTPANLMTPTLFVNYITHFLEGTSVEVKVYDRDYLVQNKMNLFLSVTEGSVQPPKFLVLSYKAKEGGVDVALVGKGITFDSGGISIKPSRSMGDMKADMMGAAAVVSALGLIALNSIDVNVTVSVPLCENLPSGTASKPGDVRIAMNGVSVEIDNTDAEGRLVLGDAMVHAQKDRPMYMIDVATLTGAICVALGQVYIGCFCNDDKLATLILETGEEVDNLCWRMPLSSKYRASMDSYVADIKNASDGKGGSCTAAIFLNEFVEKETKWAHLDIASVMNESNSVLYGKGMTGKPTLLLYKVIEKLSKK